MNRQTLSILSGGFFAALLVAVLMQSLLGGSAKPEILNEEPKSQVLVATKTLKIGDTLATDDMQWQEWPESSLFSGAITKNSLEDPEAELPLSGRLRRNVEKGEPLLKAALVKEEKGNFVAATLGAGMRAMAIKVKAESSVGGFVTPGDRVDVIMTYDIRLPSDERVRDAAMSVVSKKAAQTVLENIRVVAVDQEAKEIEETSVARTITLEVDPIQSEKLALANAMGTLSLTLRKLGDEVTRQTNDTIPEATTDVRVSNVVQELLGNENSSGSQSRMVRIYNGSEAEDILVKPYKGGQ
jgi:pilus assembly protein CpaB